MAKIKWSAIGITNASGKSGGSIFSNNRAGSYVRRWAKPVNRQSAKQTKMRSIWGSVAQNWGKLSPEDVNLWEQSAKNVQITDGFGESRTLTGFTYFQRVNQNRIHSMGIGATDVPLGNVPLPSANILRFELDFTKSAEHISTEIQFLDGEPSTNYVVTIGYAIVPPNSNRGYGSVKNKFNTRFRIPFTTDENGAYKMDLSNDFIMNNFGNADIPDSRTPKGSTVYMQLHTHSWAGQKSNPVNQKTVVENSEIVAPLSPYILFLDPTSAEQGQTGILATLIDNSDPDNPTEIPNTDWEIQDESGFILNAATDGTNDWKFDLSVGAPVGFRNITAHLVSGEKVQAYIIIYPANSDEGLGEFQSLSYLGDDPVQLMTLSQRLSVSDFQRTFENGSLDGIGENATASSSDTGKVTVSITSDISGNKILLLTPVANGTSTITVEVTEMGITKSTTFDVEVSGF